MKKFKVGDKIIISNKKSKYFGVQGVVTKVMKDSLKVVLYFTDEEYFGKSFTLGKNEVKKTLKIINPSSKFLPKEGLFDEIQLEIPQFFSGMPPNIILNVGEKDIPFSKYIEKIFPEKYFENFVFLLKFPNNNPDAKRIGKRRVKILSEEDQMMKVTESRKIVPNYGDVSINFSPIPKLLLEEYFSEEIPNILGSISKKFILFNKKLLDNIPSKKYLFGLNFSEMDLGQGPIIFYLFPNHKLYISEDPIELLKNFRKYFLENFKFEGHLELDLENIGVKRRYFIEDEKKFSDKIRRIGMRRIVSSSFFIFDEDWEGNTTPEVKFPKKNILLTYSSGENNKEDIEKIFSK